MKRTTKGGGIFIMTPHKFIAGLIATVLSLISMIIGIMLVNSVTLTFWQMICYDLLFVLQFAAFLWCAIVYAKNPQYGD